MSWLRSLLLVCVMTLILYAVYAWLVSGPSTRPAPPEDLVAQGGTTDDVNVDLGEPAGDDPFADLRSGGAIDQGAHELDEGARDHSMGGSTERYGDQPLPGGDPFSQPPPFAGLGNEGTNGLPRYSAAGGANTYQAPPLTDGAEPATAHEQLQMALAEADASLAQGRIGEAHLALSQWYGSDKLAPDDQQRLLEYLDSLAGVVVYSREHHVEPEYKIQVGETLATIADDYDISSRLLAKINGVSVDAPLTPGNSLKVVRGPFKAQVDLGSSELTLFLADGRYAGRFAIGIGQQVIPREGVFPVTDKQENPAYLDIETNAQQFAGGDPNNPFGHRLLLLGKEFAIHGTNDQQSIGAKPCIEGCIRMAYRDIDDVFDILSMGSEVQIVR